MIAPAKLDHQALEERVTHALTIASLLACRRAEDGDLDWDLFNAPLEAGIMLQCDLLAIRNLLEGRGAEDDGERGPRSTAAPQQPYRCLSVGELRRLLKRFDDDDDVMVTQNSDIGPCRLVTRQEGADDDHILVLEARDDPRVRAPAEEVIYLAGAREVTETD